MRARDIAIAAAVLAGLVLYSYGAVRLGRAWGRPDAPTAVEVAAYPYDLPQTAGGLFGFEGLGERLEAGPWGEVVTADDALVRVEEAEARYIDVPGKRVVLRNGGQEYVLELRDAGLLRLLSGTDLAEGDRVAVGDGVLLLIR